MDYEDQGDTSQVVVKKFKMAEPQLPERQRDYSFKVYTKKNMFGGFSYSQYDMFVRTNPKMQKIILRDQLLILIDKVSSLKNNVADKGMVKQVNES